LILVAMLTGVISSITGLLLSYHWSLPSGPAIVLMAGLVYTVSFLAGPVGSILAQHWRRPHFES
jgi:zinc/manganese transport system permease protein